MGLRGGVLPKPRPITWREAYAIGMATIVPETERERSYYRWYELSLLYYDALRRGVAAPEVEATKVLADEAWDAYVDTISDLNGPRQE